MSNDLTSGNIELLSASITQGAFFCKAATGPNNAACAAVPAFFAMAVFFVAARTFANTSLYKTSKPLFNLGINDVIELFIKSPVKLLVTPVIFLERFDINLLLFAPVRFLYCLVAFFRLPCISALAFVPAKATH